MLRDDFYKDRIHIPQKEYIRAILKLSPAIPRMQWKPTDTSDEYEIDPHALVGSLVGGWRTSEVYAFYGVDERGWFQRKKLSRTRFKEAVQQLDKKNRQPIYSTSRGNYGTESKMAYLFNMDPYNIDETVFYSNWLRVRLREIWQDSVYSNRERREFWSDSSKMRCIHGLNIFDDTGNATDAEPTEALKKLEELIQYTQAGQKAELSCIGIPSSIGSRLDNHQTPGGQISIEFTDREVVWAQSNDAYSHFLHWEEEHTQAYFHIRKELEIEENIPMTQNVFGASLVKLPATHCGIVFSEEDIPRVPDPYKPGHGPQENLAEMIIRNYTLTPETVILYINDSRSNQEKITLLCRRIQELAARYFGDGREFLIELI